MANASRIFAIGLFGVAGLLGLYAFTLTRAAPAPSNAQASLAAANVAPAVAVIVAAHELTPGRALAADDLAVAMQDALPAGGFTSANALIGRLPAARIPAGGALTEGVLGTGLSAAIEPGERAVAIRVDESNAVSNLVKPGDTVDVFVVLKRDSADGEVPASHARLLLPKVRVLGFGDTVIAASNADASAMPKAPAQASVARTAVLGVRVEDVDALTLAENNGRLMLALRNPADADSTQITVSAAKNASPVARAAAGVSLATLTGGSAVSTSNTTRNGPLPPSMLAGTPMLPPLPANTANTANSTNNTNNTVTRRVAQSSGGVEVIRGTRSESVSTN